MVVLWLRSVCHPGWFRAMRKMCDAQVLRHPDQFRVIGSARVGRKIPIIDIPESCRVAVQKGEVCTAAVQICMHIILLGDCRKFSVVEEPHHFRSLPNRGELYLVSGAAAIDV